MPAITFFFLYLIPYLFLLSRPCGSEKSLTIDLTHCLPSDICDRIKCLPQNDEDCEGEVIAKASVCGCCDECVRILEKGDVCTNIYTPPGGKPLSKCRDGFVCDEKNGKCTEDPNNKILPICREIQKKRSEVVAQRMKLYNWEPSDDLWVPDCDETGLFKTKQCKNKKCFCVNENGFRLFGQMERELAHNMTCACSVAVNKRESFPAFMTKPHERCTESGDYEELQCVDDVCYCADTTTGQPLGLMVNIELIQFLPCYEAQPGVKEDYLTRCEKQAIREKRSTYEFKKKGMTIWGTTTLACDYDGTFYPRQCDKQECRCSTKKGVGWKSYQYDRQKGDEMKMTCRCARDEYVNEMEMGRYPTWKCNGDGNFEASQCQARDCYCVDEDGDVLTKTIPVHITFKDKCLAFAEEMDMEEMILRKFGILPESRPTAPPLTSSTT